MRRLRLRHEHRSVLFIAGLVLCSTLYLSCGSAGERDFGTQEVTGGNSGSGGISSGGTGASATGAVSGSGGTGTGGSDATGTGGSTGTDGAGDDVTSNGD